MYKWLNILNWLLFMILITFSFLCVITMPSHPSQLFYGYKDFLLPNFILLLPAAGLLTVSFLLMKSGKVETWLSANSKWLLPAVLIIYGFTLTIYIMKTVFNGDWDPMVIHDTSQWLAEDIYNHEYDFYFSRYPNNLMLVWILTKLTRTTGVSVVKIGAFAQCMMAVAALALLYLCARKLFKKSCTCAWIAVIWTLLLTGYSPWFMIVYSDGMGYVFPVLMLYLYLRILSARRTECILLSVVLGVVALAAFRIKPQLVIMFIAILLIRAAAFLTEKRVSIVKSIIMIVFSLSGFCSASLIYSNQIASSLDIELNNEMKFGMPHFFMMGLNQETRGTFSKDDFDFSAAFSTAEERNAGDLTRAREKLRKMGVSGLSDHIVQKTRINFGDGTFNWFQEGNFLTRDEESSQNKLSFFIRKFIVWGNEGFEIYTTFKQIIWLGVLTGILGLWCLRFKWRSSPIPFGVMMLALSGLIIFELLFEARARYLFTYAPVFVLLMCGSLYNFGFPEGKKIRKNHHLKNANQQ